MSEGTVLVAVDELRPPTGLINQTRFRLSYFEASIFVVPIFVVDRLDNLGGLPDGSVSRQSFGQSGWEHVTVDPIFHLFADKVSRPKGIAKKKMRRC